MTPGLTGLWQVTARSHGDLQSQEALDTYYIRNWSPWLDLHILARTIRAVILSDGPELEIDPEVLPVAIATEEAASPDAGAQRLVSVERDHILGVLTQSGWVIEGANGAAKKI